MNGTTTENRWNYLIICKKKDNIFETAQTYESPTQASFFAAGSYAHICPGPNPFLKLFWFALSLYWSNVELHNSSSIDVTFVFNKTSDRDDPTNNKVNRYILILFDEGTNWEWVPYWARNSLSFRLLNPHPLFASSLTVSLIVSIFHIFIQIKLIYLNPRQIE